MSNEELRRRIESAILGRTAGAGAQAIIDDLGLTVEERLVYATDLVRDDEPVKSRGTAVGWDDLIEYNRRWVELHQNNTHQAEAARRMTLMLDFMSYLRTDMAVERVAYEYQANVKRNRSERLPDLPPETQDYYRTVARSMIAALIGEGP